MKSIKKLFITGMIFVCTGISVGQTVYQHTSFSGIYDFLDELQSMGLIEINSAVKPFSRSFIATQLQIAYSNKILLNKRQSNELNAYMLEYKLELSRTPDFDPKYDLFRNNKNLASALNPLGLYYKDSLFSIAIKPIWGINYYIDADKNNIYHRWGGAETYAYITKHWGLYASLRDNSESERMCEPSYFTRMQGGPYKEDTTGGDYSEMRGGITYSWNWGDISLAKDHLQWGSGYNGTNILSGKTPSFAFVKLHLNPAKWFDFSYFHGWLVSEIVDSSRSYLYGTDKYRLVFHQKYIAANIFTITPFRKLNFSIGNSIVYSDIGVHPAYLIPFAFFKSIDHTLNGTNNKSGQNSQMFFNISSNQIKYLHLFFSMFIDELSVNRITDENRHNFFSYKGGGKLSNFPIQNASVLVEFTRTLPMTYQHHIPTTTFESNFYNLGHYLRDNSQEIFTQLTYKPVKGLKCELSYIFAKHGDDFIYGEVSKPDTVPILQNITYSNTTFSLKTSYEFINNGYVFFEFINSDILDEKGIRTPEFFRGKKNIISTGFNIGF